MGWEPSQLRRKEFLILSTQGGIRAPDGSPVALGYHTGHWEVGLADAGGGRGVQPARGDSLCGLRDRSVRRPHAGHAGHVGQPGLSQRRGARAAPADPFAADAARRDGRGDVRQGAAGDDDGAGRPAQPAVRPRAGRRDACRRRTARTPARSRRSARALRRARSAWRRRPSWAAVRVAARAAAASFWARRRRARSWARRWGLSLLHSALAPSGQPIWLDMARRSAQALIALEAAGITCGDILTEAALHNAMVVHAAFGGSTNLLLHIPAMAHAAGSAAAHGGRLGAHQPADAAAGGCAAQRPGRPSHGARLSGRRRAGGDAPPARAWVCCGSRRSRCRADAGRDAGTVGNQRAPRCGCVHGW